MKNFRKISAFVLAAVLTLALAVPALAASITINPPSGIDAETENTYTIYKVFDAKVNPDDPSKVSYTLANGELTEAMIAAGFSVDTAGNVSGPESLDQDAIDAIAAYCADAEVGTATSTGAEPAVSEDLDPGYYYITTTTGTVVTIDTNNDAETVEVNDKNEIPDPPVKTAVEGEEFIGSLDEDGKNALAQVGSTVYYSVEIEKVKGAKNYVFHDVMGDGLEYNDDVAVTPEGADFDDTVVGDDTITLTFDNDWLASLENGTKITITYSATVTSDALTTTSEDGINTATLDYGNNSSTTGDTVQVYNARLTVSKQDGDGDPLAGAGFVIANEDGEYYNLTDGVVTWVDDIEDATEYTSDDKGAVTAFTGLANGKYTLIENTVPEGYNKADDVEFEIAEGDFESSNLEQTAEVTNVAGAELPSTGGIGTTIFYVLGSILVIGAGVLLVTKRRMDV